MAQTLFQHCRLGADNVISNIMEPECPLYDARRPVREDLAVSLAEHLFWDSVPQEAIKSLRDPDDETVNDTISLCNCVAKSVVSGLLVKHHVVETSIPFTRCAVLSYMLRWPSCQFVR